MKVIIYGRPDGGVSIFRPIEGARLAVSITLADGSVLGADAPQAVDQFMRGWPRPWVTAEWAETEDEFIARVSPPSIPDDAIDVRIVDESAIPEDRTFRNAWAHGGQTVIVDMLKAVEIQKDNLRVLRAPLLKALDIQFMRALEVGDDKAMAEIVAKKRDLRDVTSDPALEAATTPEALKAVVPTALLA